MTFFHEPDEAGAELEVVELGNRLSQGDIPIVDAPDPLAPGDRCHFVAAVRFGRRRSDLCGHLVLTSGWLKFRGPLDVSVGWSQVAGVERAGHDIVVALDKSRRLLRFSCYSALEAGRGGVLAQHLANCARPRPVDTQSDYWASV